MVSPVKGVVGVLAGAGVCVGLLAAPPVTADDGSVSPDPGRMMLVLDASGSMAEPAAGGQRKIGAAKAALSAMIDALPDEQAVGMRVYGATVFSADEPGACTDSQRVVDVGTDNRDDLTAAVDRYTPYGETPTGYALREAGKDLGSEGNRTIVLVSDGEPTCAPDPCKVAAELAAEGIDLRIDVVGLDVSGAARDKLQCIAEAGNGSYVDADDAEDLTDSLITSQTRATRPFDFTGTPVQGTTTPEGAPELTTGQFLDRVPSSGSLFYRVPRTASGSTIHAGIGFQGEAGSTGFTVDAFLRVEGSATSCARIMAYGIGIGARAPITYAGGSTWQPQPDSPCNTADEVLIEVTPQSSAAALAGRPLELSVYEEPPVPDTTGQQTTAVPEQPRWTPVRPGPDPVPDVVPGTSLANAPVVSDGSYALDINPGETQVLAVPLDWGQDVQAQFDARLTPGAVEAGAVGSAIDVQVMGPMRNPGAISFYGAAPPDWSTAPLASMRPGERFRTGAQSLTVAYTQRASSAPESQGAAVPGLRYISVAYNVRGDDANLPYTLTIRTNDGADAAAPEYADVEGLAPPEADSALVGPGPVDPDGEHGQDTGTTAGTGDPDESGPPDGSDSDDALPWPLLALVTAGLVALVAAFVVVRRRRTRP